ncbi:metallophosphoesterase [Bartonella raoultii]|uniref:Metallophosphoesterase n=1 Tax=Bartonella raoultii TaxID=1457020 RepID=A0ABS7I784_9HYPH|nr:metallophosphoesterase [Bartonella raoultii]MBX4335257.1 metallophosphoesterase [Bartonella raoultii]
MKYQYRTITTIFFSIFMCIKPAFSHTQNVSVNHEKRQNFINQLPKPKRNSFADRSTDVYIVNELTGPPTSMVLIDKGLKHGEWKTGDYWGNTGPSKKIAAGVVGKAATTSNAWFLGAGGWVKYRVKDDGTILTFRWYNPYNGTNEYSATSSNKDYYFERIEGEGYNARTIWYVKRKTPKNYNIVIAADPQAWRLVSGDPNAYSNRKPWLKTNRKVASALESHAAAFYIVNGDLTEFGRLQTYQDYANVYKSMPYPVYEGLGNHDYANNVRDCMILISNLSKDACAISAVKRMLTEMNKYSNSLSQFNQHVSSYQTMRFKRAHLFITGSLSYSWDYGDIHYVQLHNYPTYTAHLSDNHTTVRITEALEWLKKDLEAADKRGKVTILNFHDGRPYFPDGDSHFLHPQNMKSLAAFKSLITSHNVKAIFVGHEHYHAYCRAQDDKVFGNIPLYTAGALFRGDYYLVHVQGKNIHVKAYNGITGKPVLMEDLGRNGEKSPLWKGCSNL